MSDQHTQSSTSKKSRTNLVIGTVVLIAGFLSPLLLPFVINSHFSPSVISIISGLLVFGIPELFMLVGVAIMGKSGYLYVLERTKKLLTMVSPQTVSKTRYRIGVFLFLLPIVLGLLQPYLTHYIPFFVDAPLLWIILSDLVLIISLFILGGDFWEKLKGLFHHDTIAKKRPQNYCKTHN